MIDKLKFLIDGCKDKPKLKSILLKVAKLSEDKQDNALKIVKMLLEAKLEAKNNTEAKNSPRLSVFRSNQHIYAQLIDDEEGKTLASISDLKLKRI